MKIWEHKGFIMIECPQDSDLYVHLYTSSFLTRHPSNRSVFYFMKNNTGLKFFKKFRKFFENFEWSEEIKHFASLDEVSYIEKRDPLIRTTFPGIVFKEHQNIALDYMSKNKQFCIFLGPGTGKTLIALSYIDMSKSSGTYLVFTPAKAIDQYIKEAKKYLPYANVFDYRKEIKKKLPNLYGADINVGILNYESAHLIDTKKTYNAIILDESHKVNEMYTEHILKYEFKGSEEAFRLLKICTQFVLDSFAETDFDKFNIAIYGKKKNF